MSALTKLLAGFCRSPTWAAGGLTRQRSDVTPGPVDRPDVTSTSFAGREESPISTAERSYPSSRTTVPALSGVAPVPPGVALPGSGLRSPSSAGTGAEGDPDLVRLLPADDAAPNPMGYRDQTTPELLRSFYRDMLLSRLLDAELGALQRQGQLALWVSLAGQEAAQVGSARALDEVDTVFPSYREHAVAWVRGVDPLHLASLFRGVDFGGWDPAAHRFQLYTLVLATQTLHAVGFARAIMIERRAHREPAAKTGAAEAVMVYLGDGAASEGDASEAMSWAAVDSVPLVFFCQNNQWAISTPSSRQARVPLARRAEGFGMPGVRVDGNDVVAVHAVTAEALRRARRGGGPTFVEAVTYRMNGHSTADDPSRYRDAGEVARWRARDPIERLRRRLDAEGIADDAYLAELDAAAVALSARLRTEVPKLPDPPPGDVLRFVFADESRTGTTPGRRG